METLVRSGLYEPGDRSLSPFEGASTQISVSEKLLADVWSPPPVASSNLFSVLSHGDEAAKDLAGLIVHIRAAEARDTTFDMQASIAEYKKALELADKYDQKKIALQRADVFDELAVNDDPYARILLLQEEQCLSVLAGAPDFVKTKLASLQDIGSYTSFHQLLSAGEIQPAKDDHAEVSLPKGNSLADLQAGSDANQEALPGLGTISNGLNLNGLPDPFLKPTMPRSADRSQRKFLEAGFDVLDGLLPKVEDLVPKFQWPPEEDDNDDKPQITDNQGALKSIPKPQKAIDNVMQHYREQGLTREVDREFVSAIRICDANWDSFGGQAKMERLARQLQSGYANGQEMTAAERRKAHCQLLHEFEKASRPVIARREYADALAGENKKDAAKVQYIDALSKCVVLPTNEMRQELSQIDKDLRSSNLKPEDKDDLMRMRAIIAGTARSEGLIDLPGSVQSRMRR